jgi:predicted N-formylglutamate amidohydrolase
MSHADPPFEVFNADGSAALLLVCDHATAIIPDAYQGLGLNSETLDQHVAWDIGAADVARQVATALDATAVLSRFSRLLIDPNRAIDSPDLVVSQSDGVLIPGNQGLTAEGVQDRIAEFYGPYHDAIGAEMNRLQKRECVPAVIAIHSFTPVMHDVERPWHIGLLWNQDPRLRDALIAGFEDQSAVVIGDNEPYTGRTHNYTVDTYGSDTGLPHISIEFRQDLVATESGVDHWASLLTEKLSPILADRALFSVRHYGR